MAGGTGAAATVKVTGTVTGVTPVPPLSVTVPLVEPTGKVPVVAVSVTLPLPVPPAVESVNQGALSLAVHVKGAAAGIADSEGLRCGVRAALSGGKGETQLDWRRWPAGRGLPRQ